MTMKKFGPIMPVDPPVDFHTPAASPLLDMIRKAADPDPMEVLRKKVAEIRVMPDGDVARARYAIVGEAPATEEVKLGKGFVGPSGKLLWPLLHRLAGIEREVTYVTNLCKHPLDNDLDGDDKLSEAEFAECQAEIMKELEPLYTRPNTRILAVGALAARAILCDKHPMEVINGMGFPLRGALVVPTFHPAAALRPGGEDRLAYTGIAISNLADPPRQREVEPPPILDKWTRLVMSGTGGSPLLLGIDTEGLPDDPICMTVATDTQRAWVPPSDVRTFWRLIPGRAVLLFHNAPWDWAVLEAMGVERPWEKAWRDTMELAYLRQTEPRGLKDLGYRHFGLKMKSFEETAAPFWAQNVRWAAEGRITAGTTVETHTPKGRLRKKPKEILDDDAKALKRNLGNVKKLADLLNFPPMSLRHADLETAKEYATLDPWVTLMVYRMFTDDGRRL